MVLSGYDSAALSSRVEDELLVERLPGKHIDDLGGDTLSSQLLLSLQSLVDHDAGSDDSNVLAFLQGNALADLEVRAVAVNSGEALADHAHVGELTGCCQLLGQAVDLSVVNRVDNDCFRYGHVQSAVLERHMGAAVVCSAYAGVRADHVYRQLSVSCGHESLVKCTAGCEAAEGVHEYGAAGSGQTCCNAHSVSLCDTCVYGLLRESLCQLAGVDAVLKVAVYVHYLAVLLHEVQHSGNETVTVVTRVLLVLANQSKAHVYYLPYCALISASFFSAAAMASSHCSLLG